MQTSKMNDKAITGNTVDELNSLLRGEMSAVETYRQAIDKMKDSSGRGVPLLQQLRASHQMRVDVLTTEVRRLGGTPAEGSGAWGAFAKLVQGAADAFGEKSAIAALEEGEDHGMKEYRDAVKKVDATTSQWLAANVFPEQKKSHDALSQFKHSMPS